MKRFLILISTFVIASMCFTVAAQGSDEYELPKIPVEHGELSTVDTSFDASGLPFEEEKTSITACKVKGIKNAVYSGKAITMRVTVKNGSTPLILNKDYTVSYKNNKNVGTASVVIKGKGNYYGSLTKTFTISPKGTTIVKLTAGKKSFKATWKKQSKQTSGYQLQYSLKKGFKGAKTITVKKVKTVKKTVKKLKANKKYYVRIRTFKTINGKKYCSSWSSPKSVKIK